MKRSLPGMITESVGRQILLLVASTGVVFAVIFVVFATSTVELAAGLALTLIISLVAVILVQTSFSRPMRALREESEMIASGNTTLTVAVAGENEIGSIAKNFNAVLKQLREAHRVIEALKQAETSTAETARKLAEMQLTYDHVLLVSELGQDIVSSLNLENIFSKLYDKINSMMDAAIFSFGVVDEASGTIEFRIGYDRGEKIEPFSVPLKSKTSFAAWCARNAKDVFLNNIQRDYARYVGELGQADISGHDAPRSLVYLPMLAKQHVIGVICVQSYHPDAYTQYHLDMLHSLTLFTTAATENAKAYEELDKTLKTLKSAQNQLVQSEKMSSLGLLTAGIAHEINNPINFVSANVNPLRRDIQDLLDVLQRYNNLDRAGNVAQELLAIDRHVQELDFEYTKQEIEKLLQGIEEGANRTAEIVRGLRNFSRLDENEIKLADIHEGLDSTLTLLRNKYKDRIEIVKRYGELPKIECYPGQLNQVFMNILSNAVQAIAAKGTITLSTETAGPDVRIHLRDSGVGMSAEVVKKIFDPFFTTKDVGVGTGLGLSISFGIIEKHNGKIDVVSSPGNGTEFIISLPIQQSKQEQH